MVWFDLGGGFIRIRCRIVATASRAERHTTSGSGITPPRSPTSGQA